MASPGGRRRPLSTTGYEPLLQQYSEKPKPPPKPKPQFLKAFSATALGSPSEDTAGGNDTAGGYFQPGGGATGIGYCLSSVYKAKKTISSGDTVKNENGNVSSPKSRDVKLKFTSKDGSRPSLASLPAKFKASFEERNRHCASTSNTEPATGVLVAISESDTSVIRRTPPLVPKNTNNRMSNPFPLPTNPSRSLPTQLWTPPTQLWTPSSSDKLVRTSSLKGNPSLVMTHATSESPTTSTPSPVQHLPWRPVTFAQPPPFEMEYAEEEHPRCAFEYLEKFRRSGELCDVTFLVDGTELKAHRVVLAACSQYFESMFIGEFAEPTEEPIVIEELSDNILESMITFAYTSHIKLTEKNVYPVFEAADLLQLTGVKGACFKFFKQQINKSNCMRTWLFAESHNCIELLEASLKYIDYNFLDIVRGKEFLDTDEPDVINSIISHEDLAITAEEQVYEAVMAWVQRDLGKRKKCALEVFKSVRFPSMSKDYLMHIVDHEPLMKEDPDLLQLLIDALESHVTILRGTLRKKGRKSPDQSKTVKPRTASMAVEVVEVHRQDELLGIRIMGGMDHPQHVFRQGDKPGIFILQLKEGSAAAKVGRLKRGDRILQVNGLDMTKVKHEEAIRVLRTSADPLSFLVRHEPTPAGLKEITLVTKPSEGFGFVITGGINSYSGNPLDDTDEGIFISQIIPGGAAEQDGRLKVGLRILQVNSISMLGRTHKDALKVLQDVLDRLNLLVCDGYDPSVVSQTVDEDNLTCLETSAFM